MKKPNMNLNYEMGNVKAYYIMPKRYSPCLLSIHNYFAPEELPRQLQEISMDKQKYDIMGLLAQFYKKPLNNSYNAI